MTDVEQLLRDTLNGRAATVTEAPSWDDTPAPPLRSAWISVAAAVVTVLSVGGGIAYLSAPSNDDGTKTGGGAPVACHATLPTAWKDAMRSAHPLSIDGHDVYPEAATPNGAVLGTWFRKGQGDHTVLIDPDGTSHDVASTPSNRITTGVDADDSYAVLSSLRSARDGAGPSGPVDDIVVVNLATGATKHILADAPTPSSWVVSTDKHAAVIQDGVVYWGMRPPGNDDDVTSTDVIAYTIRSGRYAIVGHIRGDLSRSGTPEVDRDVRGVGWTGGSVPSKHVAAGLPPFRTDTGVYQPVASDGSSVAWNLGAGSSTVHWTDGAGDTRTFEIPQTADPDNAVAVTAVSGPYVFFFLNSNKGGDLVLDTRSGAFASIGFHAGSVFAVGHRVFVEDGTRPRAVDVQGLPELTC